MSNEITYYEAERSDGSVVKLPLNYKGAVERMKPGEARDNLINTASGLERDFSGVDPNMMKFAHGGRDKNTGHDAVYNGNFPSNGRKVRGGSGNSN